LSFTVSPVVEFVPLANFTIPHRSGLDRDSVADLRVPDFPFLRCLLRFPSLSPSAHLRTCNLGLLFSYRLLLPRKMVLRLDSSIVPERPLLLRNPFNAPFLGPRVSTMISDLALSSVPFQPTEGELFSPSSFGCLWLTQLTFFSLSPNKQLVLFWIHIHSLFFQIPPCHPLLFKLKTPSNPSLGSPI